jgi:hypothetical protein
VQSSPGVLGEAFIGVRVEGSGRGGGETAGDGGELQWLRLFQH